MAYVPKIFKDRAVEFPFRRLLTPVSGQANTVDVSRVPGTIFEVGDEPDAANLNAEFGKIKTETDAINTSLNVVDYTITPLATVSISYYSVWRQIAAVFIFLNMQVSTNLLGGAWYHLATVVIPPNIIFYFPGLIGDNIPCLIKIETDGKIYFKSSATYSANTSIVFNGVYHR